jgi:hypothetical protein
MSPSCGETSSSPGSPPKGSWSRIATCSIGRPHPGPPPSGNRLGLQSNGRRSGARAWTSRRRRPGVCLHDEPRTDQGNKPMTDPNAERPEPHRHPGASHDQTTA